MMFEAGSTKTALNPCARPWMRANNPGGGRNASYANPDTKLWLERCAERGFTVPTWPQEFGGAGLSKDENVVLRHEMGRINARPPLVGMGLSMIGPALLEYGTDTQKGRAFAQNSSRRYLVVPGLQ